MSELPVIIEHGEAPRDSRGRRRAKTTVLYDGPPPEGKGFELGDGRVICGALVHRSEPPRRCMQLPMSKGNGRCSDHGGRNKGQPIVTGAGSKWRTNLPNRLLGVYDELQGDEQLDSLRRTLDVLHTLAIDKLGQLGDVGAKEHWDRIDKAYRLVMSSVKGVEVGVAVKTSLARLGEAILDARTGAAVEMDLRNIIQEAASVSKVELARQQLLGKFMPEQEGQVLAAMMTTAVQAGLGQIEDPLVRELVQKTIHQEFVRLSKVPSEAGILG